MKKMTKCLLSATVATGILLGSTITALEPQQTKASDINTDIYNTNKDLASWTIEVQLAQKEYDQIDAQFEKMVSLVDDAEEKTGDKYDAYKKAKDLYQRDPSSANKARMQQALAEYYKAKNWDDSVYNSMMSYSKKDDAAKAKLDNAKTNLAKAQKLVDLLKDYQKSATPQVTVIHEIDRVPVTPTTNNSNESSNNSKSNSLSTAKANSKNKIIPEPSTDLKDQIKNLKNGKSLNLKNKGYVATLRAKHPLSMIKIVKAKKIKLHTKVKPYKLYSIKAIKRINNQIWIKMSSQNEWINSKYLNLFKKID